MTKNNYWSLRRFMGIALLVGASLDFYFESPVVGGAISKTREFYNTHISSVKQEDQEESSSRKEFEEKITRYERMGGRGVDALVGIWEITNLTPSILRRKKK
jgi:hypothetical protein